VLCFYTDGLVERRDTPLDSRTELLRQNVTSADPETVCAQVMTALVGNKPVHDDTALLALRRHHLPPKSDK
jgi:phosphoserine phosphatase RsbU/P